ncbi:FtsW/RodA/SpoVE family cell cycle protein [Paenacidovorax caeni]|nr:FtsW/RodA/SpoVE family cell cycle protein [Paenacidovorax caeni]
MLKKYPRTSTALFLVILVALVAGGLVYLIAPATLLGLDNASSHARYAVDLVVSGGRWLAPDAWRAARQFDSLPYVFLIWAVLGVSTLGVSLGFRSSRWAPYAVAAIGFLAAAASNAYGFSDTTWLVLAAIVSLVGVIRSALRQETVRPTGPIRRVGWVHSISIWGLWFLLVGISVIWLSDLAARGPTTLRFIGLRQLDAVWVSAFVLLPFSILGSWRFLSLVVQVSALWDRPRGPLILFVALTLSLLSLTWIGGAARWGRSAGLPHVSAELVRLFCAVSLAWFMARHFEWSRSPRQLLKSSGLVMIVPLGGLAVLVLTRDFGPVLVMAVALIPFALVISAPSQWSTGRILKMTCVILAWVLVALSIRYALVDWLPSTSWAPERLVLREEAMRDPFSARLDYASQIAWLLDAAGPTGFGLGAVPWCGARAFIGQAVCTKSSGVPVQFGSDYVYTAIGAVWGNAGAVLLLLLTLILIALVVWTVSRQVSAKGIALITSRLSAWIVVIYAAMLMGQLLISVAGNLGLIPLSGVTQPFLGLGNVAIAASAIWIGLALGGLGFAERAHSVGWLSSALNRYFASAVVGMCLFMLAAVAWRPFATQPVKDRLVPHIVVDGLQLLRLAVSTPASGAPNVGGSLSVVASDCPVGTEQITDLVERLSRHVGLPIIGAQAGALLSCMQARSVAAAAVWALGRSGNEAARQLERPNGLQVGVSNPYRLRGCVRLPNQPDPATGQAPCPSASALAQQLLKSSPQLEQALSVVTTSVRRDVSASGVVHQHRLHNRPVENLGAPDWAVMLRADRLVKWVVGLRPPVASSIGQGRSVTLSVKASQQMQAQNLVECFVGPCTSLSGAETRGDHMLESARARMAAVLVVDVASGEIEAAASAHTPCYQAHHQGAQRKGCLPLPQAAENRPWKVTNQALHGEAMCGSLCKIGQALALLRVSSPLTQSTADFSEAIRQSQTERFIDEFMCVDRGFSPQCNQNRLNALVQATHDLGGYSACAKGDSKCQALNLMSGEEQGVFNVSRLRLLSNPAAPAASLVDADDYKPGSKNFTLEAVRNCYANGHPKRWRDCQGIGLVASVAELFGQGNAHVSPVGVAELLFTLTAAAQGAPHGAVSIIKRAETGAGIGVPAVAPQHARRLLEALLEPVKPSGTAHSSCVKAMAGDSLMNCNNTGRWVVASKTGTPLFPHDAMNYQRRQQACDKVKALSDGIVRRHEWARCVVPPTKWYAYVLGKSDGQGIVWTKIVVVLTERNWSARTGLIDSPFDRGGNVAAEIGLRLARQLAEAAEHQNLTETIHGAAP